jgi:hypothetical protein
LVPESGSLVGEIEFFQQRYELLDGIRANGIQNQSPCQSVGGGNVLIVGGVNGGQIAERQKRQIGATAIGVYDFKQTICSQSNLTGLLGGSGDEKFQGVILGIVGQCIVENIYAYAGSCIDGVGVINSGDGLGVGVEWVIAPCQGPITRLGGER